jgi:hypothetical protein
VGKQFAVLDPYAKPSPTKNAPASKYIDNTAIPATPLSNTAASSNDALWIFVVPVL